MSGEHSFTTLPATGPANYPKRIAIIGDLGLTYNSTSTVDHVAENNPDLILMVGDMSYANLYITNGTGSSSYGQAFGKDTPIHETYQPRWDMWQRCEHLRKHHIHIRCCFGMFHAFSPCVF